MKRLMMTALVAGHLIASTQPAFGAELTEQRSREMGAFAGLRLRVPLDGDDRQRQWRAGLAIAPVMYSRSMSGESRMRIGEGLALDLSGDQPARLSLAGTPVSQLAQGPLGPDGRRLNASTGEWIAIGAGAVVVLLGVTYLVFAEMMDCDEDEECS